MTEAAQAAYDRITAYAAAQLKSLTAGDAIDVLNELTVDFEARLDGMEYDEDQDAAAGAE